MKIRAVGDDNDNHQYNHRKENLFTRFTNFKTKVNELKYSQTSVHERLVS